ncbi:MAG: ComEA family DNA-binding protein [Methylocystis sp.]|uniref:ComEA family DNA-binding protein n=1 Tax=Methylocystis sp. TaxID=1911079 RepID=UPI003DA30409
MIRTLLLAAAVFVAAPAFAETPAAKPATQASPAKMATEAQRLDLNSATVEQLSGVKGFDKTIAEAIVKARPFRSVDDLTAKKIVSSHVLAPVKDQLIVR